jgi:hypothetical protein
MKRIVAAFCLMAFIPAIVARAQTQTSKPKQDSVSLDIWIGDWTLVGTSKYLPTAPEHKLEWHIHGQRILGGSFIQLDQTFNDINGQQEQGLEILSFNPLSKTHLSHGYSNDGSTWVATSTCKGFTVVGNGTITTLEGKVIKIRDTWVFTPDYRSVSGTEESTLDGLRWTSWSVRGTKAQAPEIVK